MAAPLNWLTIQSADRLAAFLDQPFPPRHINADAHDLRMRALVDLIYREGGNSNETSTAYRIKMHGISASSTSGLIGATRNWINAVRKKQAVPA